MLFFHQFSNQVLKCKKDSSFISFPVRIFYSLCLLIIRWRKMIFMQSCFLINYLQIWDIFMRIWLLKWLQRREKSYTIILGEKKESIHYYEVDFLVSEGCKINAFEIKSSGSGKHESIREFCSKFSQNISKAYLISQKLKNRISFMKKRTVHNPYTWNERNPCWWSRSKRQKKHIMNPSNQTLKFAPQTIINETDQKLCSFMSESLYTRLPVSS